MLIDNNDKVTVYLWSQVSPNCLKDALSNWELTMCDLELSLWFEMRVKLNYLVFFIGCCLFLLASALGHCDAIQAYLTTPLTEFDDIVGIAQVYFKKGLFQESQNGKCFRRLCMNLQSYQPHFFLQTSSKNNNYGLTTASLHTKCNNWNTRVVIST